MNFQDIDPSLSPQERQARWQHLCRTGDITYQSVHRRKDGSEFPVDVTANLLAFEGNRYAISFVRDITAQVDAAKQLREMADVAKHANETKTQFLANMSHEIRTPMNAVIGLSHLTLNTDLTPRQRDYLTKIHSSAHSLLGVINDILDFSKIEAGKLDLHPESFDFQSAVEDIGQLLAAGAEDKGIDLIVRYAPDTPRYFIGDAARLRQVLLNLVGNAVKFTEKGYVRTRVEKRGDLEEAADIGLVITVEDSGIGIPAQYHAAIFEAAGMSNRYRVGWVEANALARETIRLAEAVVTNRDVVTGRVFSRLADAERWLAE